jgi:hypothetical protein
MMPDITTSSDFVPEPPRANPYSSVPGGGMMAAANGNLGGLQAALGTGSVYQASKPMMSQDNIDEVTDTLFSRVRSPEDLAKSKDARRGALSQLQESNLAPENDWEPQRYLAYGMAKNDKPWDVTHGWQNGIALAMEADLAKQSGKKKADITNSTLGLNFENGEEKIDDKVEGKSLEDLTSMANAQSRFNSIKGGAGGGLGTRYKTVAGVGLVDTQPIDPVTGEKLPPQVIIKGPQVGLMFQKALASAQKEAESDQNNMSFIDPTTGKVSAAKKQEFIQRRANENMTGMVMPHLDPQMGGYSAPEYGQYTKEPSAAKPGNAGERKMATNLAELPATPDGSPPILPSIPAPSEMVQQNTRDIAVQDSVIADPNAKPEAKAAATVIREKLLASNIEAMKKDIADVGRRPSAGVAVKPAVVTPAAADIAGVTMGTKADQQGDIKMAEGTATQKTKLYMDTIHTPAVAARQTRQNNEVLDTIDMNPNKFANMQTTLGSWMSAAGMKGSLVDKAVDFASASKILLQESNSKVRGEVGLQTDEDARRMVDEGLKITDPKKVFQFVKAQQNEAADRKIARSEFVRQQESLPDAARRDAIAEWDKYSRNNLGPMVVSYGGRPVFRSEYIEKMVADNPKADAAEVRDYAAKDWMKLAKEKKAVK